MSNLKQLRDRRASIVADGMAVVAQYQSESREPTVDELARIEELAAERTVVDEQITAAEALSDLERTFTVSTDVQITGGEDMLASDPKRGFRTFGEFAAVVMAAANKGATPDKRLIIGAAPTSPQRENVGADGGFLVPPEFSTSLYEDSLTDDALLPLTDNTTISGNSMTFPASENTPWSSGGITAYWDGENQQMTQSKDALKTKTLRLNRLTALVPITEELQADAVAVESYVDRRVGEAIRWKTNDSLISGDGVGKPLGVVGHGGTVSITKETSQTAATINIENLIKMYARCINPMRSEWIANMDTFSQLYDMKDNAAARVWQTATPGGLADGFAAILLGRPLRFVEACPTLGSVGDIILGDWQQYQTLTKAGGVSTATSMHLWFDYGTMAFRAIFRVDGQPWRSSAVSPGKGSATRGNFVTLAVRA